MAEMTGSNERPHHSRKPDNRLQRQPVLSGISLSIARGSFTAILGANGSGKSTLLKTILGLFRRSRVASSHGASGLRLRPPVTQFDPMYLLTGFDVALMGAYGRIRPGRLSPPRNAPSRGNACARPGPRSLPASSFQSSPAARNSGCSSPAPWRRGPTSWSSTSRPQEWTTRRPMRCWISSHRSGGRGRSRSCSSPTTLRRCARHAQHIIWLHDGKVLHGTANELLTPRTGGGNFRNGDR